MLSSINYNVFYNVCSIYLNMLSAFIHTGAPAYIIGPVVCIIHIYPLAEYWLWPSVLYIPCYSTVSRQDLFAPRICLKFQSVFSSSDNRAGFVRSARSASANLKKGNRLVKQADFFLPTCIFTS